MPLVGACDDDYDTREGGGRSWTITNCCSSFKSPRTFLLLYLTYPFKITRFVSSWLIFAYITVKVLDFHMTSPSPSNAIGSVYVIRAAFKKSYEESHETSRGVKRGLNNMITMVPYFKKRTKISVPIAHMTLTNAIIRCQNPIKCNFHDLGQSTKIGLLLWFVY